MIASQSRKCGYPIPAWEPHDPDTKSSAESTQRYFGSDALILTELAWFCDIVSLLEHLVVVAKNDGADSSPSHQSHPYRQVSYDFRTINQVDRDPRGSIPCGKLNWLHFCSTRSLSVGPFVRLLCCSPLLSFILPSFCVHSFLDWIQYGSFLIAFFQQNRYRQRAFVRVRGLTEDTHLYIKSRLILSNV